MLDLFSGVVFFCCLVGAAFAGLGQFYDRRDRARFAGERGKTVFLCVRCDRIYTAAAETPVCLCPQCGRENARLKF